MPERKSLKPIPKFESEDEEREFWATRDSTEHLDWGSAKPTTYSRLKPSTQTISLRLPEMLLENLRMLANKRDVPYQSLLRSSSRSALSRSFVGCVEAMTACGGLRDRPSGIRPVRAPIPSNQLASRVRPRVHGPSPYPHARAL